MSICNITKEIKFHMGHRVPNHKSKCKSQHGHTYHLQVTVEGEIIITPGISDEGMVVDFGDLKSLMNSEIYDMLDHGNMLWEKDTLIPAMKEFGGKLIIVPFIPTAENIAKWIYQILQERMTSNLKLINVRLYETETSWADYRGE